MPKKPGTNLKSEFTFFNIIYEDGSQRSNRRVPSELLAGTDVDEPARKYIMQQDREIAEKSGRPTLEIIGIERVETKRKCLAIVAASMKAALEAWGASRDGFDLFPIHKEYICLAKVRTGGANATNGLLSSRLPPRHGS